jgi:hypothetical protein
MSGDFGISVTEIHDILHYCIKLELLVYQNGFVRSISLDERLESVYKKRNRQNEFLLQKPHSKDSFRHRNAYNEVVSVTESTQSKVNEIKVNNDDVINGDNIDFAQAIIDAQRSKCITTYIGYSDLLLSDNAFLEYMFKIGVSDKKILKLWLATHVENCVYTYDFGKSQKDFVTHFYSWIKKIPNYHQETNPFNHLKEKKTGNITSNTTQNIPADQQFRPFINPVQKQE